MKIGIVGGTFNPIHVAHLMLGEYAYEECHLDEVWFMPNGNPPHKDVSKTEVSKDARMEMTNLAIQDTAYFKSNAYEINRAEVSYSYQTMQAFNDAYPDHTFYFIIGSDSLFSLEHWRCPEQLLKLCNIVVACRENVDVQLLQEKMHYLEEKYKCSMLLLQMPLLEISSSDIRKRISHQKSIKYIVPECICNYIKEKKLYEECGK